MKRAPLNNQGKVFSSLLLGMVAGLLLSILLFSNPVLSSNIVGSVGELNVTEDVYVADVYDYLEEINKTTWRTLWNVSYLYARENCTAAHRAEVGTKCWYLDLINSTLTDLNINSTALLKEINTTTYSTNATATLTKKLVGNVLASFGKNLYKVSGDRTSVDENLTGHDGNYETIPASNLGNTVTTFYFYLEQEPQDNLTLELITYPYGSAGTSNLTINVTGDSEITLVQNWNFSRTIAQHEYFMIDKSALKTGENVLELETLNTSDEFYLDYALIYTSSAALRFLRATQYNTTNVYNYLHNTINPLLEGMNDNISVILNHTDWLVHNLNCTVTQNTGNESICTRLDYVMNWTQFLRANVTDIQRKLHSHNDTIIGLLEGHNATVHTKLDGINGTLMLTKETVEEIWNMTNCSAEPGQTALCDKLDNITYHIVVVNNTVNVIRTYVTEINTTTHYIWDRWRRRNNEVIKEEIMTGRILNSTLNATIYYNITIPTKQGFDSTDYLPVRWKFWFINTKTGVCVNQNREFKNVEPYCNPLVAQYVGRPTYNYTLNISLRPSLPVGNYTVVREIEIDPPENNQPVWILHGRGPIGVIQVKESTYKDTKGNGKQKVVAPDTNYLDDEGKWDKVYDPRLPAPTLLTLKGEENVLHGSIKVEISNTFIPDKQISLTKIYEDVIQEGSYKIPLAVNLVKGEEYQIELTICEGPTFDPEKYDCRTSVKKFIA